MLFTPHIPNKTLGWLFLSSLIVLLLCFGLSNTVAAQTTHQHTERTSIHTAHVSPTQSGHNTPSHCSTPQKSGCCACLATEAPEPEAAALQPAFPPVPLHQNYISRLVGPAQPPPRWS